MVTRTSLPRPPRAWMKTVCRDFDLAALSDSNTSAVAVPLAADTFPVVIPLPPTNAPAPHAVPLAADAFPVVIPLPPTNAPAPHAVPLAADAFPVVIPPLAVEEAPLPPIAPHATPTFALIEDEGHGGARTPRTRTITTTISTRGLIGTREWSRRSTRSRTTGRNALCALWHPTGRMDSRVSPLYAPTTSLFIVRSTPIVAPSPTARPPRRNVHGFKKEIHCHGFTTANPEFCWKCFVPTNSPWVEHQGSRLVGRVRVVSEHCRYNDIVKPLLYALFFLEIPRLRLLPRVDPDFETLVPEGDIPAYCRWLVSRTPGNALFNFEEVIWQFGLDMRFFFQD